MTAHAPVTLVGEGNSGYLSLRNDFALSPSASVGALTTSIQSAINTAIAAGKGIDVGADLWPINAALSITGSLPIKGSGAAEVWSTVANSSQTEFPGASPYTTGGGFKQTTAGANILNITGTGPVVHLRDLVLRFDDAIAFQNTGHAVYGVASALNNSLPENGPTTCRWDNIVVFGHDGNHYAFYTVNLNYATVTHPRSYGGGGWYQECSTGYGTSYGNTVLVNPYFILFCAGTAHGFHMKSGNASGPPNNLNLISMFRPQCNAYDVTGKTIKAAFPGITTPPSSANQKLYKDENDPFFLSLYDPDFELGPYSCVFGKHTNIMGGDGTTEAGLNNIRHGRYSLPADATGHDNTGIGAQALRNNTTGNVNTALGSSALTANTTGANNTALGYKTLEASVTDSNNTAVGTNALKTATASSNTAVGLDALSATTSGAQNTAVGVSAAKGNTTGATNTAVGVSALQSNTSGQKNTALGTSALQSTTTGQQNTAVGQNASNTNTTVSNSTAIGYGAVAGAGGAIAIGIDNGGTSATTSATNECALGTSQHTVKIAGRLNVAQRTPTATGDSSGQVGDIASDDTYLYAKTSAGWKRVALSTF